MYAFCAMAITICMESFPSDMLFLLWEWRTQGRLANVCICPLLSLSGVVQVQVV